MQVNKSSTCITLQQRSTVFPLSSAFGCSAFIVRQIMKKQVFCKPFPSHDLPFGDMVSVFFFVCVCVCVCDFSDVCWQTVFSPCLLWEVQYLTALPFTSLLPSLIICVHVPHCSPPKLCFYPAVHPCLILYTVRNSGKLTPSCRTASSPTLTT